VKPLIAIVLSLALFAAPLHAGNCGIIYRQQAVYAAPFVAPVYYAVGQSIQEDAIAERIAAKVAQKLQALQAAPLKSAALKPSLLASKCARCHTGESAKGGVVLDGSEPVSDGTFRRIVEMIGDNRDVPKAMVPVLAGLKADDKGNLTFELINAKPKAEAPPPPDAGVLE
jgi:hypothetical protein